MRRASAAMTALLGIRAWRGWRLLVVLALLVGSLAILLSIRAFGQDPAYHRLADQRTLLGIPNFGDVVTNLPFLLVGLAGVRFCLSGRAGPARPAWLALFAGVAMVGIGSTAYHLAPTDESLAWDRLPMTVGFMGLLVALLAEHFGARLAPRLLAPAVLTGCASVVWWRAFDDLRFYAWIHVAPLVAIPLLLLLFRGTHSHRWMLLVALGLYALSKAAEILDRPIFAATGAVLSGHSLKHLLAAGACFVVLRMLAVREPRPD